MRPRLLTLLAVALAVVLTAGCEAPTSYAAKVGDATITEDQLDQHLEEWASSDTLLQAVGLSSQVVPGLSAVTWSMPFADYVLSSMIDFQLHDQEFDRRHLEIDAQTKSEVESQLVGEATPQVWQDVSPEFKQYLIDSISRQFAVQTALGADYDTWHQDQYVTADILVNARYGSWGGPSGVLPPVGPQPAPTGT